MFTKWLYVKWNSFDCYNTVSLGYKYQPMQGNGHWAESKMLTHSKCLRVEYLYLLIAHVHMSDFKIHDDLLNTLIKQTQTQGIHTSTTDIVRLKSQTEAFL